jgi:hypothetical protein
MNAIVNVWDNDAFSFVEMTDAINNIPFIPGQLGKLNLFETNGIRTTNCTIEQKNGQLHIIEPSPRGGPGETRGTVKGELVLFEVPHLQVDQAMSGESVQNAREFGTTDQVKTLESAIADIEAEITNDFDTTIESHRIGAIKGLVISRKGVIIADLYDKMKVAPPADIQLNLTGSKSAREVFDRIRIEVEFDLNKTYSSMHCLCGDEIWHAVTNHPSVIQAFNLAQNTQATQNATPDTWTIGGITFERYKTGKNAKMANGDELFIGVNEGRLFPRGVRGMFLTRYAPADYDECVNTKGLPRYAKQIPTDNNKGRRLEVQSNPLNICTIPGALRKLVL